MERLILILTVLTAGLKSLKQLIKKTNKFIGKLELFIKQCYFIVWNLEKIKKVKTQG